MTAWKWIDAQVVQALHEYQLAEHGGLDGVRDAGLVESALARPKNLAAYGEPDAADLAAAYAYGLAKNRAFADGNKRTSWVVARLFLADNGYTLQFRGAEALSMVEQMAGGALEETSVANWFRARIQPD